uniref:Uncharacterized protein n=2 Tax=Scleropages formosus TaxID=113540 RepID=A0A8C9R0L9_SCLFO
SDLARGGGGGGRGGGRRQAHRRPGIAPGAGRSCGRGSKRNRVQVRTVAGLARRHCSSFPLCAPPHGCSVHTPPLSPPPAHPPSLPPSRYISLYISFLSVFLVGSWSPTVPRRSSSPSLPFRTSWTRRRPNTSAGDDPRQPRWSSTATHLLQAQSAEPSPPQMDQSTYSPPTMRELQLVMEQHLQKQEQLEAGPGNGSDPFGPTVEQHCPSAAQWANRNGPEPNGNEAYVSSLCTPEDSSNSTITKGEVMTSEGQQENLSSPSSISR